MHLQQATSLMLRSHSESRQNIELMQLLLDAWVVPVPCTVSFHVLRCRQWRASGRQVHQQRHKCTRPEGARGVAGATISYLSRCALDVSFMRERFTANSSPDTLCRTRHTCGIANPGTDLGCLT